MTNPNNGVKFYDNLPPAPVSDFPGLFEVERIYLFDWSRFTVVNWQDLLRIYQSLPGSGSLIHDDFPWWFGEDEEFPHFYRLLSSRPASRFMGS